jgi:type II secretory pathway component GspD/PulD (secretin)
MKTSAIARGIVALGVAGLLVSSARAQGTASDASREALRAACSPATLGSVQTYFLNNATGTNEGNEIQNALRNTLPPEAHIFFTASENAITVCALPDQQALAAKLLHDLDKPRHGYRLTYTLTESDGQKRIGTQHYTMIISAGQRSQMKVGSKIPVATGSFSGTSATAVQTQFQYVDVGMNFEATFVETATGGMLKTKVEQSSAEENKLISGVSEPLMRQTVFEGSPVLVLGKPAILGSADITGSTRHEEIEVMVEEIK